MSNLRADVITRDRDTSVDKSLGHLFIGTILTFPVLYYGSINHWGPEQRITLFSIGHSETGQITT